MEKSKVIPEVKRRLLSLRRGEVLYYDNLLKKKPGPAPDVFNSMIKPGPAPDVFNSMIFRFRRYMMLVEVHRREPCPDYPYMVFWLCPKRNFDRWANSRHVSFSIWCFGKESMDLIPMRLKGAEWFIFNVPGHFWDTGAVVEL